MGESEKIRQIARAYDLAVRAHEGQWRNHGRRAAYINHVADVARRVSESPDTDRATFLAAILHDVAEKTEATLAKIEKEFGSDVARIVAEVTDDKGLSRSKRHRRQVEGAGKLSDPAKRIRLADKASKMAEIAAAPPRWWGHGSARRKIRSAREVVAALRGSNPPLEAAFDREASAAEAALSS